MNRVYRHIWSKALGRVIVVPECARGGGGKKGGRRRRVAHFPAACALSLAVAGVAVPGWAVDLDTDRTENGTAWNVGDDLNIGVAANGTLTITNGGQVNDTLGLAGYNTGFTGEVTVSGSGSAWTNSSNVAIGYEGHGILTVEDEATVSNVDGYVGDQGGSTGTATVTGANSTWSNSGFLTIGNFGDGELTVSNGGEVTNANIGYVGRRLGSEGTVTVTGAGSTWTNGDALAVGFDGDGTLNVEAQGHVHSVNNTLIGDQGTSVSTATVTGAGSTLSSDAAVIVGQLGNGTLIVENGGRVTADVLIAGHLGGSDGTINVVGPNAQVNSTSLLRVGDGDISGGGVGRMLVSGGGVVTNASAGYIGAYTGANGIVTITGAGSQLNNSGMLYVGGEYTGAVGVLTLTDDGAVNVGAGSGTLRIADHSGATGTLNIGAASGDAAAAAGTLNAATVSFGSGAGQIVLNHNESAYSFAANISGGGSLLVENGVTALTGANSYSGGTTISGGTLAGDTTSLQGNIANNGALVFDQGVDGTYAGILSGAGTLTKQGSGNVTFSGTSAGFTGDTVVSGGTLTVTGTLGDDSGGANGSSLTVENGGTLTIDTSRNVNAASITNEAGGTVNVATDATLRGTGNTLNNSGVINVADMGLVTDAGAINNLAGGVINFAGAGTLESDSDNSGEPVTNEGTINLNGNNSQTVMVGNVGNNELINQSGGQLNVNAGRLNMQGLLTNSSAGAAVGGVGGIDIGAGGVLDATDGLLNSAGGEITNAGTISGDVQNNAGAILTSTGQISGGRFYQNRGTTNAEGTISYDILNRDAGVFNVTGALAAFQGFNLRETSVLNVTGGGLTLNGTLSHQSTAANGVTIAAGRTLSADTVENGDTNVNAVLLNNGTLTATNPIVNAGTLQNNGTANGGMLNSRSLTNAGILNGGLTNSAGTTDNSGTVNGGLTVNDGTVTNTGTVNGGIAITGGTFITHAGGQSSNIGNNGALVFDQAVDGAYAGVISGNGTLTKQGAGALTLDDDSSAFAGTTTVSGGMLVINGALGGTLNMDGGRLGGSGSLGDVVLESGATLAPGNSIGTMNVANYTFNPGSTYEVEIKDGGFVAGTHNDWLNATGTVTINGGAVHVKPENGTDDGSAYAPGTYTIATAAGGVTGTFDPTVTDDFAFLNFTLSYDAMNVLLSSQLAGTSFCQAGMSANQCAAGAGAFAQGAGDAVYDAVLGLSNAAAGPGLDQLSGEGFASAQGVLAGNGVKTGANVLQRIEQAFAAAGGDVQPLGYFPVRGEGKAGSWAGWASASGGYTGLAANANAAALDATGGGLLAGGHRHDGKWLYGGFAGAGYTGISLPARNTTLSSTDLTIGAYAGWSGDRAGFAFGAAYTHSRVSSTRNVAVGGLNQALSGSYGANTISAFGEINTTFSRGGSALTPYGRVGVAHAMSGRFAETGGSAALTVAPVSYTTGVTELGVRAQTQFAVNNVLTTVSGGLGWRHTFGGAPRSSNAFAGGTPFTVSGVSRSGSALVVAAGIEFDLPGSANLSFGYDGQFGAGGQAHEGRASLGIRF